jgi:hypothetical protein
VRRGAEDVLTAVLGQDLDQGAVHVKRDRSDVHARILPQDHYRTRAAAARRAGPPGAQAARASVSSGAGVVSSNARSSFFACVTSRSP